MLYCRNVGFPRIQRSGKTSTFLYKENIWTPKVYPDVYVSYSYSRGTQILGLKQLLSAHSALQRLHALRNKRGAERVEQPMQKRATRV